MEIISYKIEIINYMIEIISYMTEIISYWVVFHLKIYNKIMLNLFVDKIELQ